jgi:hypothetical protein
MNEYGLLQPWLDESQSRGKILYHITATTKQLTTQNTKTFTTETPNTATTKQQKQKTKQNNKYLIDAFNRFPSNSITISPRQI